MTRSKQGCFIEGGKEGKRNQKGRQNWCQNDLGIRLGHIRNKKKKQLGDY